MGRRFLRATSLIGETGVANANGSLDVWQCFPKNHTRLLIANPGAASLPLSKSSATSTRIPIFSNDHHPLPLHPILSDLHVLDDTEVVAQLVYYDAVVCGDWGG